MAMVTLRRALGLFVIVTLGAIGLLQSAPPPAAGAQQPSEYEVKAVFLYNFTKYVEWPPETFRASGEPLVVCVLGTDPFGSLLDDTVRGETVYDKKLVVRRLTRVEEAGGCHLLFVSASEERDVGRILKSVQGTSILTVGEVDGFAERGGIINLRKEQNKVRFEINVETAERSGLKISSQLLKLGKIVKSGGG